MRTVLPTNKLGPAKFIRAHNRTHKQTWAGGVYPCVQPYAQTKSGVRSLSVGRTVRTNKVGRAEFIRGQNRTHKQSRACEVYPWAEPYAQTNLGQRSLSVRTVVPTNKVAGLDFGCAGLAHAVGSYAAAVAAVVARLDAAGNFGAALPAGSACRVARIASGDPILHSEPVAPARAKALMRARAGHRLTAPGAGAICPCIHCLILPRSLHPTTHLVRAWSLPEKKC